PLAGGNPIEVAKPLLLVGRQSLCDLHLDHKTVSKQHCLLSVDADRLYVRDLSSTNGCRVNGQRVRGAHLLHDDILTIAVFKYRVAMVKNENRVLVPGSMRNADRTECLPMMEPPPRGRADAKPPAKPAERQPERPPADRPADRSPDRPPPESSNLRLAAPSSAARHVGEISLSDLPMLPD
ncbi:MAG: FHA domain-containing protein, partial [Planctomycetia bacterium]